MASATGVADEEMSPPNARKPSIRRNAWGNMSYAEMITAAIESAPEKRMTLAQIYDWIVKNVPYFQDKGDNSSSASWKVFHGNLLNSSVHLFDICFVFERVEAIVTSVMLA